MSCLRSGCQNEPALQNGIMKELCLDCWDNLPDELRRDYYRAKKGGDLERWRKAVQEELA